MASNTKKENSKSVPSGGVGVHGTASSPPLSKSAQQKLQNMETRAHQDKILLLWKTTTAQLEQGALIVSFYELAWCTIGLLFYLMKSYFTCNERSEGTAKKGLAILQQNCTQSYLTVALWLLALCNALVLLTAVVDKSYFRTKLWCSVTSGVLAIRCAILAGFVLALFFENPCEILPSPSFALLAMPNCSITWSDGYWKMYKVADIDIYTFFAMVGILTTLAELYIVEFFLCTLDEFAHVKHDVVCIICKIPLDPKNGKDKLVRKTESV